MNNFEKYLLDNKIRLMKKFAQDLKKDFKISVPEGYGFTKSDFFHFGAIEDKKYVHKEALLFFFTNALTYNYDATKNDFDENNIQVDPKEKEKIDSNIKKMIDFFRTDKRKKSLYPRLLEESENFFVFEFYQEGDTWRKLSALTRKDARYIRKNLVEMPKHKGMYLSPFKNQMCKKIMKNKVTGELKLIDIKSYEVVDYCPRIIYMFSYFHNDIYICGFALRTRDKIIAPFEEDYPVDDARLKRFLF